MPLNLDSARHWLSELRNVKIQSDALADDEALDEYLDQRDANPFDGEWTRANRALDAMLATLPAREHKPLETLQEQARERFYKTVIRQTGSADLAAYASDDISLIVGYLAWGCEDSFVSGMQRAYGRGAFPL
ncbi:hypothetical protein G7047_00420 [Diaphorobacter sp. HDW4A]|uniref:hypothetical protein n=1 Tax=Diaphorobacter sp. HDW4A TaxID=2714924 RepID=UPI00140E194C|nr:hypothetical protein [Diaphorobacter sp. HDW4A]QIL78552.1 hypothetical protein G7047_00420 [Diaphorobacter sp. HDW4A]